MTETISRNMVSRIVDALYGHDYKGWSVLTDQACEMYTYEEAATAKLTAIVVRPNPRNNIGKEKTNLFIHFFETDNQYHITDVNLNLGKLDIIETDHTIAIPIRGEA